MIKKFLNIFMSLGLLLQGFVFVTSVTADENSL